MSNGSAFWHYCGEVTNEHGNGLCLLMLMGVLLVQSLSANQIIASIGQAAFFNILAGW
jgi:hypothetical protein